MRLYRWLKAKLKGRVWLKCPLCQRGFSEDEPDGGPLFVDGPLGLPVCANCRDAAERISGATMKRMREAGGPVSADYMEPAALETLLRGYLEELAFYRPEHRVSSRRFQPYGLWLGYRTREGIHPQGQTAFDLNVIGRTCFILWLELDREYREQEHGTALLEAIEGMAAECGCDRVRLTPSGETPRGEARMEWFKRRGYERLTVAEVVKDISSLCRAVAKRRADAVKTSAGGNA